MQGLWAVPWLMHVNGYTRDQAAFHLLLTGSAMLIGFLSIAAFVVRLSTWASSRRRILKVGMGVGIAALLLILLGIGPSHLLWFVLGLVFSVSNLAYALLAAHFPRELSGRVNTALNLGAFVGAFGLQWGIGALVDVLRRHRHRRPPKPTAGPSAPWSPCRRRPTAGSCSAGAGWRPATADFSSIPADRRRGASAGRAAP